MRPVLFVTGHAPPDRVGAFARLHEREHVQFALFGGRAAHGPLAEGPEQALPSEPLERSFPFAGVSQRDVLRLASSGDYRAVICGTGGRAALLGAWWGARRARVPFLLWSSLWAHPLTPAHAGSYPLLLAIYSSADAVVTYGSHVSAYVRARGARNVHIAPQAVDNDFWSPPGSGDADRAARFTALFVGRPVREKGLPGLMRAWKATGLGGTGAVLLAAGATPEDLDMGPEHGVVPLGTRSPLQLRNLYAASDVLIMPSIRTRTFREPWGLVANEAFNQRLAVIATDAVGAAAGGLVRHERNGLIVRAGNTADLTAAIVRLRQDPDLRARLGAAGARDVAAFTQQAWAAGFAGALRSVSASREPC